MAVDATDDVREPDEIALLVTLDEAYLPHLETLLTSIAVTNAGERFCLHLLHRCIPAERLERLASAATRLNITVVPHVVDEALFANAPITKRYPQEMYYRLLAAELLPGEVGRMLYLDPDTLVINPLRPLWELDLQGCTFAAAAHDDHPLADIGGKVSRVRLDSEGERYFNSGVLLIDLDAARREVRADDVFACVRSLSPALVLPDQDVLNALYGGIIREIDELIWNYDARNYRTYFLASGGTATPDWVMEHTAVLHFCGRSKPWKENYPYRFGTLYKHYAHLARRVFG